MTRLFRDEARRLGIRARYGRRRVHRAAARTSPFGLFLSFLKVGATGFGGGLAVLAQIRTLVVTERKWLSDREFAEGFALAQSLPGTYAGNAVTYVGLLLHGWQGATASLVGFLLPSFLMMIGLAAVYEHVRALPDTDRLFHGLNAAVVALILVTALQIGRRSLEHRWQYWVAAISLAASLAGATTFEIVAAAGLAGVYAESVRDRHRERVARVRRLALRRRQRQAELEQRGLAGPISLGRIARGTSLRAFAAAALLGPLLAQFWLLVLLGTIFIRVGAVTFGGGFVMIPIIEQSVVETQHWLKPQEFADATALAQITPGPIIIAATFIGYRVAGLAGAVVATFSVFTPSYLMTIAAGSSLRRFQANHQVQAFLRGISPAVTAMLVAAAWGMCASRHSLLGRCRHRRGVRGAAFAVPHERGTRAVPRGRWPFWRIPLARKLSPMQRKRFATLFLLASIAAACEQPRRGPLDAAPPTSGGEGVYVSDDSGRIHAVSPAGTEQWVFAFGDELEHETSGATRDVAVVEIASAADGTVVALLVSLTGETAGEAFLLTLEATGRERWHRKIGEPTQSARPLALGRDVYVGGADGSLHAYDLADGKDLWTFQASGAEVGSPHVAADGTIYVRGANGRVHAIDADGRERWVFAPQ